MNIEQSLPAHCGIVINPDGDILMHCHHPHSDLEDWREWCWFDCICLPAGYKLATALQLDINLYKREAIALQETFCTALAFTRHNLQLAICKAMCNEQY